MASNEKKTKKRAKWDTIGKYRYLLRRLDSLDKAVELVAKTQRLILQGLKHQFQIDSKYIEDIICRDDFDTQILWELRCAGLDGLLPRDIAKRIGSKRLTAWEVTRHIRRMNARLEEQLSQDALEKHGMRWAMTAFLRDAWGSTKEEVEADEQAN
jgi:hypothetical protein